MNILKIKDFIAERMKIVPITNDEFGKVENMDFSKLINMYNEKISKTICDMFNNAVENDSISFKGWFFDDGVDVYFTEENGNYKFNMRINKSMVEANLANVNVTIDTGLDASKATALGKIGFDFDEVYGVTINKNIIEFVNKTLSENDIDTFGFGFQVKNSQKFIITANLLRILDIRKEKYGEDYVDSAVDFCKNVINVVLKSFADEFTRIFGKPTTIA
jgi:hypothetical protein